MAFKVPEQYRVTEGAFASVPYCGNYGAFIVKLDHNQTAKVICSESHGWQHVSVSRKDRCLTWNEMCQVKDLFWDKEDCVVQFHPPQSEYINNHPFCLHLWKQVDKAFPSPPSILVGI